MENGWRTYPGAQGRRLYTYLYAQPQRCHRRGPRDRRDGAGAAGARVDSRRRGDRVHRGGPSSAQTAADVSEALEQLGDDAVFEWKMDGARIQVHKAGDSIHIYTRSLNDVTAAVPEIVEMVQALPARELILDGEAIAFTEAGRARRRQQPM